MIQADEQTQETSNPNAVWGEETAGQSSPNQASNRRVGSVGASAGIFSIGSGGEDWTGAINFLLEHFAGGILDRLIVQAQEQVNNAEACIDWYVKEKEKAEASLQSLVDLQNQLTAVNPEPDIEGTNE